MRSCDQKEKVVLREKRPWFLRFYTILPAQVSRPCDELLRWFIYQLQPICTGCSCITCNTILREGDDPADRTYVHFYRKMLCLLQNWGWYRFQVFCCRFGSIPKNIQDFIYPFRSKVRMIFEFRISLFSNLHFFSDSLLFHLTGSPEQANCLRSKHRKCFIGWASSTKLIKF